MFCRVTTAFAVLPLQTLSVASNSLLPAGLLLPQRLSQVPQIRPLADIVQSLHLLTCVLSQFPSDKT